MTGGFIYFIAATGDPDVVKIGFTSKCPILRRDQLQSASPKELDLMAFVHAPREVEQVLHEIFRPLHSHREWFFMEKSLRHLVMRMADLTFVKGVGLLPASPLLFSEALEATLGLCSSDSAEFCADWEGSAISFPWRSWRGRRG